MQFRKLKCCSFIFAKVTDFQFVGCDFADVALFFGFQLKTNFVRHQNIFYLAKTSYLCRGNLKKNTKMKLEERPYIILPLEPRLHDVLLHEAQKMPDGLLLDGDSLLFAHEEDWRSRSS